MGAKRCRPGILMLALGLLPTLLMSEPAQAFPHGRPPVRVEQGEASYYGPGFHGRKTASGKRFNQRALTAAHPDLPFGTEVRVTNLENGRTVRVEINDRGPYARGRIIDLSSAAAGRIGITKANGIAAVRVETVRN